MAAVREGFVLDASLALAWCFDEERSAEVDGVLDRLDAVQGFVPALWPYEVANSLLRAVRRGRLDGDGMARALGLLRGLPIAVDTDSAETAFGTVLELATRTGLTVYDASYLELARRLELPLATLDQELGRAAASLGVPVLP